MTPPKTLPIKHVEIKLLQLEERIELQKYLRHVYKVNQHKLLQMDKDFNSSCSFSSSSSVSGSSNSSSSSMSCDSNSVSSSSSSMSDNKYASCNSSSSKSRNSSHHVIYSAVHTIKRMTKKYRKPPRTMPS